MYENSRMFAQPEMQNALVSGQELYPATAYDGAAYAHKPRTPYPAPHKPLSQPDVNYVKYGTGEYRFPNACEVIARRLQRSLCCSRSSLANGAGDRVVAAAAGSELEIHFHYYNARKKL